MIPYRYIKAKTLVADKKDVPYERTVKTWHTTSNVGRLFVVIGTLVIAWSQNLINEWLWILVFEPILTLF